jgi:alanine racemase
VTARLRVDLAQIAANIARVRETVAPAELMLVVKDDAYGHGLVPVIRAAAVAGVGWFGAFDVATGCAVRAELGPDVRIFTWIAASRHDVEGAISARLDIGVGDAELLEDIARAARAAGVRARVHLKIDTGLHRNGVRPEAWPEVVAQAAGMESAEVIEVVGVWSHIAEASDDEDDRARGAYESALAQASAAGLRPRFRHLAASAASFARPEFRYDLVRVGAFCYGIRPAGGPSALELGLSPAARLEADVVRMDEGGAVLGIGSLEGLPSTLAGSAWVGTPAGARRVVALEEETVIEAWPGAGIGDVVAVFGPGSRGEPSSTDLAELIDTIGEEIAVRVSPLVPRVYDGG